MAGKIKNLLLAEGVTVTPAANTMANSGSYVTYANHAAYVSAKGSAAVDGDVYYNTTDDLVYVYANGAWEISGGGLTPLSIDHTYASTLAPGLHYIVDMSGASGTLTLNFPVGAVGSVIAVSVIGQSTSGFFVTLNPNGAETVWTDEEAVADPIIGQNASTVRLTWDAGKNWVADVSDLFTPSTWGGDLTVTDGLTVDTNTLVVDAVNNRVGIGTTSPAAELDVIGHVKIGTTSQEDTSLTILSSNTSGPTGNINFGDPGGVDIGKIKYAHNTNTMSFSTASTVAMSINSSGNVGIGRTPTSKFDMYVASGVLHQYMNSPSLASTEDIKLRTYGSKSGGATRYTEIGTVYYDQRSAGGSNEAAGFVRLDAGNGIGNYLWVDNSINHVLRISDTKANVGSINGTVVGAQTSDERTKDELKTISYGLDTVMQLQPIEYDQLGVHKLGFGAQTTQPIIPESVFDTKEDLFNDPLKTKLGMEYVQIIPVLTKAIQEQQEIIESQRTQIESQAATIDSLVSRIEALENK
jgi:hypothetical protein